MKHKICYILPEYREDGATHFSYIGGLLREANKELDVFLIIEKGTYPSDDFGCTKIKLLGSSNIFLRLIKLKWWLFWAYFHGYRDFYVHYSFLSAITAGMITRIFGGRVFYWNCGEPWKYKRTFLREHFERFAYKIVAFLVTGTEKLGDEYADRYGIAREKVKIMPNWIDNERFKKVPDKNSLRLKFALPEGKKVIFFAHHLSLRKGSRMILPVLRELVRRRNDFFLIVAGTGPDEKKLRARAEAAESLSSHVRFVGAVPNRKIQNYFAVADIFFMPSQEEGFPRVILESMASGVPIAGSDVGSVPEIVPPSALPFLTDPNDVFGFVRSLNTLLSKNSERTEKMAAELRLRANEFETASVAKKFIKLFS
jgi:glycosyltransferase involved in cell wall biosynthesis